MFIYISVEQLSTNFKKAAHTDMVFMCMQEQFNRQIVLAQPDLLKRSLDGPTSTNLAASSAGPKQQQDAVVPAELPAGFV